jgi:hypothetical protein
MHRGFLWGALKERQCVEGCGVDERILLKWILKIGLAVVDLINLF